ncbi:MAG: isoleucine--tRNA ligase [Phycisphaeraceae bacterium]|nr:isoleucine--tRNA ligase [Phycisphaeraceae bacterium]
MSDTPKKVNFKSTLNLPRTSFPMKANLVLNEPQSSKRWDKLDLYNAIRKERDGAPKFVFHDGPPYANGSIHLGHLLNKVLKDFVVRTQTMMGKDCSYIPGWDCHGLPIEHKVMQDLGDKAREMEPIKIRRKCKSYAEKFVKQQMGQMKQLLTVADYDNPYLTMNPGFEKGVIEVFSALVEKGLVFRQLKPVHWSIDNQTALAEAELEYEDREDTSVFVMFDLTPEAKALASEKTSGGFDSIMIWTTTPWTLPANMAVAVHERYEYGVYQVGDRKVVLATELAAKVLAKEGIEDAKPLETFKGKELVGLTYNHPFIDRVGPVVHAEYVTLEDGTGMVHTAPGHGVEDYQTGLREGIEVYCPVQGDGTFDTTAPQWLQGKKVWDANQLVVDHLTSSGHMFHTHKFMHSYPHDWRGKTPVIFRATEQWFIGVDKDFKSPAGQSTMRKLAMDYAANKIRFIPEWGRNRMRGMLESRPDWCISRQRSWGLPIPAFYPPEGVEGDPLLTAASVKAVAECFGQHGSDSWFVASPDQILASYDAASDPDAPAWVKDVDLSTLQKGNDTFDVWFESGSSWNACMRNRDLHKTDGQGITDLYLEGSDQHRGWFQHSLLPAIGVTGKTAFETVLTHGFMVDKDGKKMSKSLGNTLDVSELLKEFGADVCRWWVSRLNVENDIKVDHSFFKLAGEEYRKIRNTIRFLLSNLSDFDSATDKVKLTDEDATSVDAWAIGKTIALAEKVTDCYANFNFRGASELLYNFCNDTMSAEYLVAVKDRLYCDALGSQRRKRAQATVYRVSTVLIRLLAPIMPHTADEAWGALEGDNAKCVHLMTFQDVSCMKQIPVSENWPKVMKQRDSWMRELEKFRQANDVDNPLDLGLVLPAVVDGVALDQFKADDLADLCGISKVTIAPGSDDALQVIDLRNEPRCDRSWKRDGTVKPYTWEDNDVMLSARDAAACGLA